MPTTGAAQLFGEFASLDGRASNTVDGMAKATVRLTDEDRQLLERLAPEFGGKTATVREALQRLAADHDRKVAFDAFLKAWDEEDGPLSNEELSAVAQRCGL